MSGMNTLRTSAEDLGTLAENDSSTIFPGVGDEERYGTHNYKLEGQWNPTADVMVSTFKDGGHPVFRASSALGRRFLRKVGNAPFTSTVTRRMQSFYFAPKIRKTDQYYGAMTDSCDELALQNFGQSFEALRNMTEQSNRHSVPEEVNTVVKAFETVVQASLNRFRERDEKCLRLAKQLGSERKSVLDSTLIMDLEDNRSMQRVPTSSRRPEFAVNWMDSWTHPVLL